ncbi:MAG: sulfurtransferase-like selenium metabolism protein YedF [Eggerthellaceae bacterium]|nr:sulfurtransferase-like selenium metabolism protein YedF [Eggerthellaceae bacterium]
MKELDARGQACPLPVVKAKKALKEPGLDVLAVLVDNETAVTNLKNMAQTMGTTATSEKEDENTYRVTIVAPEQEQNASADAHEKDLVVVVDSQYMGCGDDELGAILMKSFMFTLTQLEELPKTVLFYNTGVKLTCEGSELLEDIKKLEEEGVTILSCGTCLNHFGLTDSLSVGQPTNMYSIVEIQSRATNIIRPS